MEQEIVALQRKLRALASCQDSELIERYQIKGAPRPPGLYWRLRGLAAFIVRGLIAASPWKQIAWPVSLKQLPLDPKAKPVLIWAVGTDRDELRAGCDSLSDKWGALRGFAPVLITDVADFAYFSRLGWLVEFLPALAGHGKPYEDRKLQHLAGLYREAPVLPVSAGVQAIDELELRRLVAIRA